MPLLGVECHTCSVARFCCAEHRDLEEARGVVDRVLPAHRLLCPLLKDAVLDPSSSARDARLCAFLGEHKQLVMA